jgi:hypothetical protein
MVLVVVTVVNVGADHIGFKRTGPVRWAHLKHGTCDPLAAAAAAAVKAAAADEDGAAALTAILAQ